MASSFARMIQTIDSHTEGNSTRVIVGGVPVPPGKTLLERREALWRHDDGLRRMLNFEPRGHGMMCSVLLMPPIGDGRLLDHHHGAGRICADVRPLPDRRRHHHRRHRHEGRRRAGDAAADRDAGRAGRGGGGGRRRARRCRQLRQCRVVRPVRPGPGRRARPMAGSPSRSPMAATSTASSTPTRSAWSWGRTASRRCWPWRRRSSPPSTSSSSIRHPKRPDINRCYQTLLTSAATTTGDYRQAIMCPPGSLDRSPCGTGTSARVALLHTRGELALGEERRFEGPLGTYFSGAVAASEAAGWDPLRAAAGLGSSLSDRLPPVRPGAGRSPAAGLSHRPQASRRAGADGVRDPA